MLATALDDGIIRIDAVPRIRTPIEVTHAEHDFREPIEAGTWPRRFRTDQSARTGASWSRDDRSVGFGLHRAGEEPEVERRLGQRRCQHAWNECRPEYFSPLS